MKLKFTSLFIVSIFAVFNSVSAQKTKNLNGTQIAFLSDVHLQDLFGGFSDSDYKGVLNTITNQFDLLRILYYKFFSYRFFNENFFYLLAG